MATNCSMAGVGNSAQSVVDSQINRFTIKGDAAFQAAMSAIQGIALTATTGIESQGLGPGLSGPSIDAGSLPTYTRPTPEPETPDIDFEKPPAVSGSTFGVDTTPDFSSYFQGLDRPTLSAQVPTLQLPAQPSTALPNRPDDPAPLVVPAYPAAPELTEPELPNIREVELPELDRPDLSTIESEIAALRDALPDPPEIPPDIDFLSLVNNLYNSATGITQDTITNLVSRIIEMLSGGTGIPADIATAMRDRAFAAEDKQAFQAEAEVLGDWLARGFTLPGGVLDAKLWAIRQQNRDKKAQLNRDIWIEEAKQEIENLRVAVQQGIAYEGMRKDALVKLYGICGQLAEQQANVQLKLLDAAIAVYKAQMEAWQIQFSVIKDQIQIELAKVEIFKAELEGQKLIGQLNLQDVEVYKAQLAALDNRVAIYKAQVDAANSMLQAELGKLQYAAERVKIYTAEIGAWETEWKAYGEAVRGELGKTELYKSMVQGFSAEVEAYAKDVDAAKSQASLQLESMGLKLKALEAKIEERKVEIQAESVRVNAMASVYETEVRAFSAKTQAEDSYVSTELKKLDYGLNVDKFKADVLIKDAQLEQEKTLATAKLAVDAMDAVARTGAQLAGSAMSAMNVGASISEGFSTSKGVSCSESYNYDMSS